MIYEKHAENAKVNRERKATRRSISVAGEKQSLLYGEVADAKRKEINDLILKYSLNPLIINGSLIEFSLLKSDLSCGNITNSVDYLVLILKYIYRYSEEEVSDFLNRNTLIMKSLYKDFRIRLGIFNHIGLLSDVIFKGSYYLNYDFTKTHFDTNVLFAVIVANNISDLSKLMEVIEKTPDNKLKQLVKEYPLTSEIIYQFDKELEMKIKKEAFKLQYEQRRLSKMKK